ncbi:MAG: hypothetical protein ACREXU_15225 [Gammaproteobacteria bacterium]
MLVEPSDNGGHGDPRLAPIVALLNARRLQEGMQGALGDTRIEDLWTNYFAVSANLTSTEMVVHDRGPAWETVPAARSTVAFRLPALRPSGRSSGTRCSLYTAGPGSGYRRDQGRAVKPLESS